MNKIFFTLFGVLTLFVLAVSPIHAAIMTLDPASYSSPIGQTFNVKLTIDTEGDSVTSADAVLLYDSNVLQVVDVVEGDLGQNPFFPDFFENISPSELYIGASVIDPIETKTGQGVLATITFRGNVSGITNVTFDCTPGKTSDTNISKSDKNATDIVECARLVPGTYTIGEGTPPTPTTAVNIPIPTATPQPIPTTGAFDVTTAVFGMGVILSLFAIGGKILLKV